jgi:cytoskeletal protein CcmA (bactofilin family)
MTKKFLFLTAALLLGLCAIGKPALAAEFKSGEAVNINATDKVNGDLYAASNNLMVDANLPGDAFLAGSVIRVTGKTAQSLHAAGSVVTVAGEVGHALRVAGSQLMISGTINGDVMAAGAMVQILPGTVIKGDLYLGAGSAVIDGKVLGNVKISGGDVTFRADAAKDVQITAQKLNLAAQTKIAGKLAYQAPAEASIAQGATVTGGIDFKKVEKQQLQSRMDDQQRKAGKFTGIALFWFFGILITNLIVAYVGWYFFKQRVLDITNQVLNNFARQMGWGFVWLVVVPIACVVLLITLVGIPFSFFFLMVYVLAISLAKVLASIVLGSWLIKLITKKGANGNGKGWPVDWKVILLGVLVMSLLMLIPVLGWIACFVFFLAALGGIMTAAKAIAK